MKSLRSKRLITITIILILTQTISIIWVWHESEELIELYVTKALATENMSLASIDEFIREEIVETMAALFLPAIVTIIIAILSISITISYLTKPLNQLVKHIESKTPYNLSPLHLENTSSELNVVEESINQLLQRLEQGLENERRFTADVAHELRTPLAGLRLNLELIEGAGITQASSLITRIDQMMLSIEQLLQLARAGQKLLKGDAQHFDFIQEVITPMQMEWEEGISSHCSIEWDVPKKMNITGDSGLLYLMLRNLLDNVRSYASGGQYVLVKLSQQASTAILEIMDEGPGVSEEKISQLTQRFMRLDQTHKGYGLGLNIVNRIILTHQGTLEIQNRKDRSGLHVKIQLPQF